MGLLELEKELAAVFDVRDEPVELTDDDGAEISDAARATSGCARPPNVGTPPLPPVPLPPPREGCELMEDELEEGLRS